MPAAKFIKTQSGLYVATDQIRSITHHSRKQDEKRIYYVNVEMNDGRIYSSDDPDAQDLCYETSHPTQIIPHTGMPCKVYEWTMDDKELQFWCTGNVVGWKIYDDPDMPPSPITDMNGSHRGSYGILRENGEFFEEGVLDITTIEEFEEELKRRKAIRDKYHKENNTNTAY